MSLEKFYANKLKETGSFAIPYLLIELSCHLLGAYVSFRLFFWLLRADYTNLSAYIDIEYIGHFLYVLPLLVVWSCNALPRFFLRQLRRFERVQTGWLKHNCKLLKSRADELTDTLKTMGENVLCLVESPADGEETSGTTLWFALILIVWYLDCINKLQRIEGYSAVYIFAPFLLIPFLAPLFAKKIHWLTPFVSLLALLYALTETRLFVIPDYKFDGVLLAIVLLQFPIAIFSFWRRHYPRLLVVKEGQQKIVKLATRNEATTSTELAQQEWSFIEEPAGGYSVELANNGKFTLGTPCEVAELSKFDLISNDWLAKLTRPRFFKREGLTLGVCLLTLLPIVFLLAYTDRLNRVVAYGSSAYLLENLPTEKQADSLLNMNPYSTMGHTLRSAHRLRQGRFEEAIALAKRAKDLAGLTSSDYHVQEAYLAGKMVELLSHYDLKIAQKAIEVERSPSSKNIKEFVSFFEKTKRFTLSIEGLYEFVLTLWKKTHNKDKSKYLAIELLHALTFIDKPTLSPLSTVLTVEAEERYKEALSLLAALKAQMSDEEHRLLTARVHFKFEKFPETLASLEGSTSPEAKLLYTSAARYCGKSKEELLALVGTIGYKTKRQDNEVAMLLGLILAQSGDLDGARALLRRRYEKQTETLSGKNFITLFKILEALICNQNPTATLANNKLPPVSFEGIVMRSTYSPIVQHKLVYFKELEWGQWMSTADMEYLVYLVTYAKRNLSVFDGQERFRFLPAPDKDVLVRLAGLEWYPYAERAKELREHIL